MKKLTLFLLVAFIVLNAKSQITVSSNNNVGIKTTSPNEALEINGSIRGNISGALRINSGNGTLDIGAQNTAWTHIYTDRDNFIFNKPITLYSAAISGYVNSGGTAYDVLFRTNNTDRFIIKGSTGYIGINNINPTCALDVTGIIKMNGVQVQTSDVRLKENIQDLSGSLASLNNLHGVKYRLIPNAFETLNASISPFSGINSDSTSMETKQTDQNLLKTKTPVMDTALYNRNHIGFLAQEVQKVYPELVYADKNGILSVDYISMIPILVESIKEQQVVIIELKAAIEELKKKVGSQ